MNPNGHSQTAQPTRCAIPVSLDGSTAVVPAKPGKLLRLTHVEERIALRKSSIYFLVKSGAFPAPVRLTGARAVAWREEDIDRWICERVQKGVQA